MMDDWERSAVSFGILAGEVTGALFCYYEASPGLWAGLIGPQVVITGVRLWKALP